MLAAVLDAESGEVRARATEAIERAKQTPALYFTCLATLVQQCRREHVRQLACVLLRQSLSPHTAGLEAWQALDGGVRGVVTGIFEGLMQSDEASKVLSPFMRRQVTDAVATLAASSLKEGPEWPALVPMLLRLSSSPRPEHRESALNVWAEVVSFCWEQVGKQLLGMRRFFIESLKDPSHAVQLAAFKAVASIAIELDEEAGQFSDALPLMVGCMKAAIAAHEEEHLRDLMMVLTSDATPSREFFRPHLVNLISFFIGMGSAKELEPATRRMAVAFLVGIGKRNSGMVRKVPGFAKQMVLQAVNLMMDLPEMTPQEWTDAVDDDYETYEGFSAGLMTMDVLANIFKGKTLLPELMPMVMEGIKNQNWVVRHAAALALEQVLAPCEAQLKKRAAQLAQWMMDLAARDPHPRVKFAALTCLGTMASEYAPEFQEHLTAQLVPRLLDMAEAPQQNPRVVRTALLAIVDILASPEKAQFLPSADRCFTLIKNILMQGARQHMPLVTTAVALLAAAAHVVDADFKRYYDTLMPILMNILRSATSDEARPLRARVIEAIGLIAMSVGRDVFGRVFRDVMPTLMNTMQHMKSDDPQLDKLVRACSRIATVMVEDFVPLLPHCLPPLFAMASNTDDMIVTSMDSSQALRLKNDPEYERLRLNFRGVGESLLFLKTSLIEDKALAMTTLLEYAAALKTLFAPHVHRCLEVALPLLTYPAHELTRQTAVAMMPTLMLCLGEDESRCRGYWNECAPKLLGAIKREHNQEALCSLFRSLSNVIDELPFAVPPEQCAEIHDAMREHAKESIARVSDLDEWRHKPDYDAETEEDLKEAAEEEGRVLGYIQQVAESLVINGRVRYMEQFMRDLHPMFSSFLGKECDAGRRCAALCVYTTILRVLGEERGAALAPMAREILKKALEFAGDEDCDVRQQCLYAMGIICSVMKDHVPPEAVRQCVPVLVAAVEAEDSRSDENAGPTENAIASIVRICKAVPRLVDSDRLIDFVVQNLPLVADEDEACIVHDELCDLVESNNAAALGPRGKNLPRIVQIFGSVIDTDLTTPETKAKMARIWGKLPQMLQPPQMQQLWNALNDEQRAALKKYAPEAAPGGAGGGGKPAGSPSAPAFGTAQQPSF
jgi:hypothetical protein